MSPDSIENLFRSLEREMNQRFGQMSQQINERFDRLEARIDHMSARGDRPGAILNAGSRWVTRSDWAEKHDLVAAGMLRRLRTARGAAG